jgi:hypothetical protein
MNRHIMPKSGYITALLATLLLGACSSEYPPITDCPSKDGMQPICLFQNPEDLVLLPDGKTLLISQMGPRKGHHHEPGSLVFLDTRSKEVTAALPVDRESSMNSEDWGARDCPGNPGASIAPHGIALRQRDDLRWQLAVVNHGGRESVEMFELLEGPQLQWRGCVVPPDGTYMNDLALLKNGGFVASHMFDRKGPQLFGLPLAAFQALAGGFTGYVFEWQPASGFRVLEDSHGPFLNGVELSNDGQQVYAAVYLGGEIKKLERVSGKQLASIPVKRADNLAWDDQGNLLAVSHHGSTGELLACHLDPGSNCVMPYSIVRIDPQTLSSEVLLSHAGAPMGAGTVARQVGGDLYIGSFSGDRIVKLAYPGLRSVK